MAAASLNSLQRNRLLKILHIIDSLDTGGKERRLLELLKALRSFSGIENHLVTLSDTILFDEVDSLGARITLIPRRSRRDLSVFRKLYRLCRQYRPDVIHSWESMCSVYAVPVAKLLKIKFINGMITTGRINKGERKWIRSKLTFPFSDMIFANSHAGLAAYNAPGHKSICIHNGFDFNRVRNLVPAQQLRKQYGIRAPKAIGMVAAIDRRKDIDGFLEVARRLLSHRKDACFIVVGGGPLLNHYRKLAAEGPSANRIHFVGRQTQVESFIDLFDIGLLLTRSGYEEGVSNAIMEYMALAKPVVATLGGGTPEIVVEQQTGFLIPAHDHELLLIRLTELLDNPQLAQRMGEAGKRRIQEKFTSERMAQETIACYRNCLNGIGFGKRNLTVSVPAPPV